MTKKTNRAPNAFSWMLMHCTELTLERARRGRSDLPDDLAAKRILVALHEAAHFVVAAHDGLELYDVEIPGVRERSKAAYGQGAVYYRLPNSHLPIARFHWAGALHDMRMTGEITFGAANDWADAVQPLFLHCAKHGISPDGLPSFEEEQVYEVTTILLNSWKIVRTLACAFLTYSDASGRLGPGHTATLYKQVRCDLFHTDCSKGYGEGVLDAATIRRVGTFPEEKVTRFIEQLTDQLIRQPWVAKFLKSA